MAQLVINVDVDDVDRAAAFYTQAFELEQPARLETYGWLALLSDPFGHGFCFLQFTGRGYDELLEPQNGAS